MPTKPLMSNDGVDCGGISNGSLQEDIEEME